MRARQRARSRFQRTRHPTGFAAAIHSPGTSRIRHFPLARAWSSSAPRRHPPVCFADETAGEVDVTRLIFGAQLGVFAPLRDPALFARLRLDHGAVTWLNGLDLAPDAMYDAAKGEGRWRPGR